MVSNYIEDGAQLDDGGVGVLREFDVCTFD